MDRSTAAGNSSVFGLHSQSAVTSASPSPASCLASRFEEFFQIFEFNSS
jgi:hypothetical protein